MSSTQKREREREGTFKIKHRTKHTFVENTAASRDISNGPSSVELCGEHTHEFWGSWGLFLLTDEEMVSRGRGCGRRAVDIKTCLLT